MTKRWLFWCGIGLFALLFIYLIRSILLPFVVGILMAYILDPLADKLEERKLSRTVSTLIICGIFFISLMFMCVVIPPAIAEQAAGLLASLPDYVTEFNSRYGERISAWLGAFNGNHAASIEQFASNISGVMLKFIENFVSSVFQSGMFIVNLLGLLLITPVVTFYLLRDWDVLVERADKLLPRQHAGTIRQQLDIIDQTLAGFMRGQLNVCLLMAAYYGIALSLAGLKFGLAIGAITGLLVIIPYIGFGFGFAVGMAVAFFQFESVMDVLPVLAAFMVGQAIEGYWLTPKLVGEKVGLHPVWVIFGLMAGGALFGFLGVLLAVPVTAVLGVLLRFTTQKYLQSGYYSAP